jgi:hypothetical protein
MTVRPDGSERTYRPKTIWWPRIVLLCLLLLIGWGMWYAWVLTIRYAVRTAESVSVRIDSTRGPTKGEGTLERPFRTAGSAVNPVYRP